jgi:hypothetical protein
MRKLEISKRFGAVYREPSTPGNFTIFCPSCPQPGINLPPDWKEYPKWLIRRTITVDGNMKADHIKMRKPEADVKLTNGRGYMVEEDGYKEYMSVAKEPRLVGFHVILQPFQLIFPEVIVSESPCCQWRPLGQTELGCHWCCSLLLHQTWMLHSNFGLRYAKKRAVGFI